MLTKPRMNDKIHHVPNGTYALVAQLDRVTDYESVGRGFESLPSHQEKPEHVCVLVFLFVSTMEGARTGRRRIAPQAISPVGCCLARGFQRVGMSTVEAVKSKDFMAFLFCKPWLHGRCYPCPIMYGAVLPCNQCPFLHQVSRARRSFAFISGSASLSNSKRAVMEMVGSPAAGTACGLGASGLA